MGDTVLVPREAVLAVIKYGECDRARWILNGGPSDGGLGVCQYCDLARAVVGEADPGDGRP